MPKLWNETIEAHRREVHEAIQEQTAELVSQRGLRDVTMSQIADATGIGRATLYKYYSDVESILHAWHQRQVSAHLRELDELSQRAPNAEQALRDVLEAYALIRHRHHDSELGPLLHHGQHLVDAEHQLMRLVRELMARAAKSGRIRSDVGADELCAYALHALGAASSLPSKAAVRRLVDLTWAGLSRK